MLSYGNPAVSGQTRGAASLAGMKNPRPTSAASSHAHVCVVLAAGDLLRLNHTRSPATVLCRRGTCWLTQEGDALDHLLSAGVGHRVQPRGLTLVQALSECVVELPIAALHRLRRAA